jgi:hypothetical protein
MGALCTSEVRHGPAQPAATAEGAAAAAPSAPGGAAAAGGLGFRGRGAVVADEVSLVVTRCRYHEVLSGEDAAHLLPEFCCQHGMSWLDAFARHGVDVSLERSMAFDDECCTIRVARQKPPPQGGRA